MRRRWGGRTGRWSRKRGDTGDGTFGKGCISAPSEGGSERTLQVKGRSGRDVGRHSIVGVGEGQDECDELNRDLVNTDTQCQRLE